jgi:hypothetical protein
MSKMYEGLRFSSLTADDLLAIAAQPSQELTLGLKAAYSREEAEALAGQPVAWSCFCGPRLVACFGIFEGFPGQQGVGWAILASGIGACHLELTRFVKSQVEGCGLARLDVHARAADIEETLAAHPDLDSAQIVTLAMTVPTPECRWAQLLGLKAAHLLRRFGAAGESVMLFELVASTNVRPSASISSLPARGPEGSEVPKAPVSPAHVSLLEMV